jgi:hypothetical protein
MTEFLNLIKDKLRKDIHYLFILSYLIFLYLSITYLVLGSLSSIQFQQRIQAINGNKDSERYSVYRLLELTDKNYANKEQREKIISNYFKIYSQLNDLLNSSIISPIKEREKRFISVKQSSEDLQKEITLFSKELTDIELFLKTSNNEFNGVSQNILNSINIDTQENKDNKSREYINRVSVFLKKIEKYTETLNNDFNSENKKSKINLSLTNLNRSINEFNLYEEETLKKSQKSIEELNLKLEETNQIYKEFQKSSEDLNGISDEIKDLLGELTYLKVMKFNFLAIMPPQLLTLILTLCMGALGSLIFITREFFNGNTVKRTGWYIFRPFLGMVTAISIFVLIKSGQLVISDSNQGISSETLNPFFVSFLAIISGLLSEEAYDKIQTTGIAFLQSKSNKSNRYGYRLNEWLKEKNKSIEDMSIILNVPTDIIHKWILETETLSIREQELVSAFLSVSIREIFTDIPPRQKHDLDSSSSE